jgi:hypothetical protein
MLRAPQPSNASRAASLNASAPQSVAHLEDHEIAGDVRPRKLVNVAARSRHREA